MKLVVATVVVAVAFGYARGGTLERLGDIWIRWPYLVAMGLTLQFAPVGGAVASQLSLLVSFVLLTIAAVANLARPGFRLVLFGVLANFLVIATNHGMPVSLHALGVSGQMDTLRDLVAGAARHHLVGPGDRLTFLADIMASRRPWARS